MQTTLSAVSQHVTEFFSLSNREGRNKAGLRSRLGPHFSATWQPPDSATILDTTTILVDISLHSVTFLAS